MQKVIQLRVVIDYEKDVFRDIEIKANDTFLTLHTMIQEAFGFDNSEMASFYESNDDWEKGQEISLLEVKEPEEGGEPIWLMDNTPLNKIIFEKNQKLLYVFDFMLMWYFYLDVTAVSDLEPTVILPRIVQTFGTSPEQYSKSPEIFFDSDEMESDEDEMEEDELEELFRMMGDHRGG
jgi:hypothetical protein